MKSTKIEFQNVLTACTGMERAYNQERPPGQARRTNLVLVCMRAAAKTAKVSFNHPCAVWGILEVPWVYHLQYDVHQSAWNHDHILDRLIAHKSLHRFTGQRQSLCVVLVDIGWHLYAIAHSSIHLYD